MTVAPLNALATPVFVDSDPATLDLDYDDAARKVTYERRRQEGGVFGQVAQTREALRLAPDKPIPHLTRALERSGVAVAPFVLTDDPDEQPVAGGHFGVSYWGGVDEPALIGYFPGSQGDRERFTLAHEVGHLVLHTFRPRAADAEREADRFAGALLMPRERAEENTSERATLREYARLKATWGVSIQALIQRGYGLDLIGETRRRSLFVQLSSKGWCKHEPVVGRESPLLLWTLLSRKFGQRPYRLAAELLAVPPTMLRSIAPTPVDAARQTRDESAVESSIVAVRRIGQTN
jgi:Zn-dependent peptidase ImmA (M78 family)